MKSKWFEYKEHAIQLRRRGSSIGRIERKLGIPRSTLSGWFRNVTISEEHKKRLHERWLKALIKARKKSAIWHKEQKQRRLLEARNYAIKVLEDLNGKKRFISELTLAILYVCEGRKTSDFTSLGSSDIKLLKFFLEALKYLYKIDLERIRCTLSLRADQNAEKMKRYWARGLTLPLKCFKAAYKDPRTLGSKTYPTYRGVCSIQYNDISIKRKLLNIADLFLEKSIGALSSVG